MKNFLLILMSVLISSCAQDSQEKYDLKSPCVAAEIESTNFDTPCTDRQPVNKGVI